MIERYTLPPFDLIWSGEHRIKHWKIVASAMVRARYGDDAYTRLMSTPEPEFEEVLRRERATRHDVVAFLDTWRATLPPDLARMVHRGLSSSDLVDTTNALHMVESSLVVMTAAEALITTVTQLALKHFDTLRLGRTHGQPAEVVSFGHQLSRHVSSLLGTYDRFTRAVQDIAVVKMSGATGSFRWTTPEQEVKLAGFMGAAYSAWEAGGQRVARDGYARWVSELAILASICEDILLQIRLGQQFGIEELFEPGSPQAVGSSAMPHKANPIQSETMTGLAKLVRAQIVPVMEGIPTWQERDITHSSVERIALRTASTLTYYILVGTVHVMEGLRVDAGRMGVNIQAAGDLINSSHYLVELVDQTNMPTSAAREVLQGLFAESTDVVGQVDNLTGGMRPPPRMDIEHVRQTLQEVLDVGRVEG